MSKLKPILPSLREKKRYLVFEIISENKLDNPSIISKEITEKCSRFLGEMGMAKAGILILNDKYNKEKQKGIIKVNNKMLNELKAALCLIKEINNTQVIVKSAGVSGILKKAQDKFITA
jgi:ribonuclease P/MRP protein subunit POP5